MAGDGVAHTETLSPVSGAAAPVMTTQASGSCPRASRAVPVSSAECPRHLHYCTGTLEHRDLALPLTEAGAGPISLGH